MGESAPASTLIGRTVGNYEVVSKLGEGGMGAVYLARHPRIGKQVALKVLHSEFSNDPNIVDRFFTEAKSVNDIQHPNIVDIIDYGEIAGGDGKPMVYFIMEFLEGQSVAELVAQQAPLEPQRAFMIAAQIADALAASHRHQVVHRDLKPDNIFLINRRHQSDFVKVLDFGIAKLTGDQPGSRRTRTGVVIGTPYYMSPEQCEGKGNVDSRTDIYALGVVLFELLTGRVPFEGEGYGEILVQHLTQPPPRPAALRPGINPYVEVVCLKALEKNRDTRYQTMDEFRSALVDPVTYVDQRGGVHAFLSGGANVRLGSQPAQQHGYAPVGYATPVPPGTPPPVGAGHATPMPTPPPMIGATGVRSDATPFPGTITPYPQSPTPPPAHVDDFDAKPPRSKAPLFVIGGLLVAAAAVALVFTLGRGGGDGDGGEAAGATTEQPEQPPEQPKEVVYQPPPTPEKVSIKVGSSPKGAEVFVGDEKEPRGQTPFEFDIDKGTEEITLTLRREGYKDENKVITPDRALEVDVDLTAIPKVAADDKKERRSSRSKRKKSSRKKKKRSKLGDDILAPEL